MESMFIFNGVFTANSKKSNLPFYAVKLFERRQAQDKSIYFKDVQCFVDKPVFDSIVKSGFKFGDIVSIQTEPAMYFGGSERLTGLELIQESPYYDL